MVYSGTAYYKYTNTGDVERNTVASCSVNVTENLASQQVSTFLYDTLTTLCQGTNGSFDINKFEYKANNLPDNSINVEHGNYILDITVVYEYIGSIKSYPKYTTIRAKNITVAIDSESHSVITTPIHNTLLGLPIGIRYTGDTSPATDWQVVSASGKIHN